MGGGKGGSAPKTPDYTGLAESNAASNWNAAIDSFRLNNPDTYNQYGRVDYNVNPTTGQASIATELSPEQQKLYDRDVQQNLAWQDRQDQGWNRYNQMMSTANSGRDAVEQALYNRSARFMDPQFQQGQAKLDSQLANEGVFRGSERFQTEQDNFARQKMGAYADAQDRAILAGGAEQSRVQDQAGQNLNLLESMYRYQNPLQAGGVVGSNVQGTDYAGAGQAQFQGDLNKYNAGQASQQNFMNSLFSLGGTLGAAALSDVRTKRNIRKLGELPSGVGVYSYSYVWGGPEQTGVLAQEVAEKQPSALVQHPSGFLAVNYAALEI